MQEIQVTSLSVSKKYCQEINKEVHDEKANKAAAN